MTTIKGHHRITGASPDGDSVRFHPDDPDVSEYAGVAVKTNSTGGVQLRPDAIDALETHETPPHAPTHRRQRTALGDGASAALLDLLAYTDATRDDRGYVTLRDPCPDEGLHPDPVCRQRIGRRGRGRPARLSDRPSTNASLGDRRAEVLA